ncbi:MAG: type II/IV secretion system protein [Burkholderiales bacterium]|nr:type II/IV secretion system protein [Burkholderiales bacterium]
MASAADFRRIADLARRAGTDLGKALEEQLGVGPDEAALMVGEAYGYPVLSMAELSSLDPAVDVAPFAEMARRRCLLLRDAESRIVGVISDPNDAATQDWAEALADGAVRWCLASHGDVEALLARTEDTIRALETAVGTVAAAAGRDTAAEELSLETISGSASPIVRLVNSTLYDALRAGASDIHLETTPEGLAIKYRIDGVLAVAGSFPDPSQADQVVSRIKVMAELDIAERRVPQDGRFKVLVRGRDIDFRVSVMPSIFGEDAVLRILDKKFLTDELRGLRLEKLGFEARDLATIRRLSNEPYGMFLVTGPTGSGKTTTLYAAITEINTGEHKIVTIEDPVEYQLPGVLQIPVNEKKGLTFARGLRSILRHDPDKIMVGEIRDAETAQIAVQSALTGHLVFTTVHANNVFDVLGRLMHMEVDPYSFVSALNGILAQRLVRLVCPNCAAPHVPEEDLLTGSGLARAQVADWNFRLGAGCGHCRGSGYRGRKAIAEFLVLSDELRELIVSRQSIRALKAAAAREGTRTLRMAALDAVRSGDTTLQEINRVTFVN